MAKKEDIPIHRFVKGERKDDVMHRFLRDYEGREGVLFIGVAQEKATVPRTIRKRFGDGGSIPWIEMSYDLRRLRLHGLIQRIEGTHRYRLTHKGLVVVHFYHRTYARLIRPALSVINGGAPTGPSPEERPLQRFQAAMDSFIRAQAA